MRAPAGRGPAPLPATRQWRVQPTGSDTDDDRLDLDNLP